MPLTRILHRGGNLRSTFAAAEHPAVDALEADVWVRHGSLFLHHDRPLGLLPLLLGRRRLHRRPRDLVSLDDLLNAVADRVDLVLDLRSWFGDPAPDLARALMALERVDRISVTCENWRIADRVRAWLPAVRVGYSVRSEHQLIDYERARRAGTQQLTAVTVRHSLLGTAGDVARIRAAAGHVTVWTVDDIDRALELSAWGVDGIVSNRLTVLNAL